jgi:hypothetical protein
MATAMVDRSRRWLTALGFAALLPVLPAAGQTSPDLAVVAHPDVGVEELSSADLRRLLLGDREFWPSGARVSIVIRAPVARERDAIVKSVCRMTEAQFRQHWIGKVFRAETPTGPKIAYSADMARDYVSRTAGAITLLDPSAAGRGVKVLKIDGKLPGQAGYPIR